MNSKLKNRRKMSKRKITMKNVSAWKSKELSREQPKEKEEEIARTHQPNRQSETEKEREFNSCNISYY